MRSVAIFHTVTACFSSMSAAMDQPLQQQTPTEQPPQPAASGTTPSNTRPIKPEEQALLDELQLLTQQYGQEFPNICQFVQKGGCRDGRLG